MRDPAMYPTDVPLVDIQNVWKYVFASTNEGEAACIPERDCPCNRTPFPEMLIQWKPPDWPVPLRCFLQGNDEFTQIVTPVHVPFNGHSIVDVAMRFDLTETGGMQKDGLTYGVPEGCPRPPKDWIGWRYGLSNAMMCCVGLSFMHVKGARIEDPRHVSRQARRQWERSKQQMKVLRLDPLDRVVRIYDEAGAAGNGARVHLVRGHFKDFSKGAGVGGNPNARGLYWTPPHVRGNKELGIVAKQYEIGEIRKEA